MVAVAVLEYLVAQNQQKVNSHENYENVRPFPSVFLNLSRATARPWFGLNRTDQYLLCLFRPWIGQQYAPVSTFVLRQVQQYHLPWSIKLIAKYPAVLASPLPNTELIRCLNYEHMLILVFFEFRVSRVDVSFAENDEVLQLLLELFRKCEPCISIFGCDS